MSFLDFLSGKPKPELATARIDGLAPYPFHIHSPRVDKHVSRNIADTGAWEPFETLLIQRLLPHFDVFLDLGANIGWYAALAQRVMKPGSEIHAFEPDPHNFHLLQANAPEHEAIGTHLSRSAVSDRSGAASLYRSGDNLGDHRLNTSEPRRPHIEVPVTTLDAYFGVRQLPPVLAKLDTQGSEPAILRGARHMLPPGSRDHVLVLEFWPTVIENAGENLDAFIERLAGFTDKPYRINHDARLLEGGTWDHFTRRAKTDLSTMKLFFDLLLIHPDSKAAPAIADLISSQPEGAGDAPVHI
jgi:FkbM family methyltransferase